MTHRNAKIALLGVLTSILLSCQNSVEEASGNITIDTVRPTAALVDPTASQVNVDASSTFIITNTHTGLTIMADSINYDAASRSDVWGSNFE